MKRKSTELWTVTCFHYLDNYLVYELATSCLLLLWAQLHTCNLQREFWIPAIDIRDYEMTCHVTWLFPESVMGRQPTWVCRGEMPATLLLTNFSIRIQPSHAY